MVELVETRLVALGDVVEFLDHRRRPITAKDRVAGKIPYFGANGQQGSVAGYIFDEPLILMAEDGGYFDEPQRGIAYQIEGKSWVNNHAHVLRPRGGTDIRFLTRVLENYDVRSFLTGTTRAKLTKSAATRIPISLPPLEEQRRIAAILDKADELRTKRREALAHLDTLTQSIFHSMFGDPAGESTEVRLDDLCEVSSGITKGRRTSATELTPFPYVAVSNVQDRALNMSVVKEIAVTRPEAERYRLKRGDLLLTEGGDPDKLGRGTIWNDELPWCLHQNHVFRVRPKEDVVSIYLNWFLASREARSYFLRMAKQTTGIASINKTQLSATPVKLPRSNSSRPSQPALPPSNV